MRLIDADQIEFTANGCGHPNCKDICEYTKDSGECCGWLVAHKREVDKIPTVDAVVVVRCGECEFWERDRISCEGLARCRTGESGVRFRAKYDYCSRGIPREGIVTKNE